VKNIHVIPTDKPSRFFKDDLGYYFSFETLQRSNFTNQHIYITSDEQLKFNDYYTIDGKEIYYCNTLNPKRNNNYKKIILTTDQDLIKDGVQAIDDDFLQWFVKNPSCESVETYSLGIKNSDTGESGHYKYEIIIPKEEAKQETVEQTAVEWLIKELDNFDKGISEYFSKVAIYNHARRMENRRLIDLVQSLKDYTYESHTILGVDGIEFVEIFKQQEQ
jgi:hypothetical protein